MILRLDCRAANFRLCMYRVEARNLKVEGTGEQGRHRRDWVGGWVGGDMIKLHYIYTKCDDATGYIPYWAF